jgi:beta-lactamase regulating signal transducer with metallopeptidase domain
MRTLLLLAALLLYLLVRTGISVLDFTTRYYFGFCTLCSSIIIIIITPRVDTSSQNNRITKRYDTVVQYCEKLRGRKEPSVDFVVVRTAERNES